ncbi:DegV family protein [Arthrobacter sp.]|uniref:DegV family protein n=1 Tax=Arthrobacter sp. TaxID=1667 RepID=UPI00289D5E2C|nr:DegV family protein [Arthrobacter sp.]
MDWTALRGRWFKPRVTGAGTVPPPRVAVVTDSSCSLPAGWAGTERLAALVRVVSMPVMIGDQIYGEGTDRMIGALALALAQGQDVRTSRPSPGQFEKVYAELADAGYEAVVSVHLSAKLSGTVDSARLAARASAIPVQVIDTGSVAMGLGFAVQAAAAAAAEGADAGTVAAAARSCAAAAHILFYVPSLDQLRRGGRIGAAAGWFGTLLAVKPILAIRDGLVVPIERVRTAPKALARLEELCRAELSRRTGPVLVAVHHFGNEAEAERLASAVIRDRADAQVLLCPLPAVLAAHAGLGVLAVAISQGADPAGDPGDADEPAVEVSGRVLPDTGETGAPEPDIA